MFVSLSPHCALKCFFNSLSKHRKSTACSGIAKFAHLLEAGIHPSFLDWLPT